MLLAALMVKKLLKRFIKKNLKKANQEEFRIENVTTKKRDTIMEEI